MNEPLFGSLSPPWPATPFPPTPFPPTPFPPTGWPVSPMPVAGRPLAAAPPPVTSLPGGLTGGLTPATAMMPTVAELPSFASDVAVGVPVPALLATVAVRRGQPLGPTNDQEIEDFVYDVLELLPGSGEVDVRCEGGRVTLTGTVHYKRLKRDVGEIAWAIPGVTDVHNTITIAARRRSRAVAPNEPQAAVGRKSA